MSDKRMNIDEPGDPQVSAAYRDMARERSPEHLDHVILNAARSAAKPRRNKAFAWLRPAAWVATIGVCLAIVVEISLLENHEQTGFDAVPQEAAPAAVPATEMKRLEKQRPSAGAAQKLQPMQAPATESDLARDSAERSSGVVSATRESSLEEAESRARQLPSRDDSSPASFLRTAPMPELAQDVATERYCDESQTSDPNTWLACILDLESRGLYEAAGLERELLTEAFPPPDLIP